MSCSGENDVDMLLTSNNQVPHVEVFSCDESSNGGKKHGQSSSKKRKEMVVHVPKKEGKKKSIVWNYFVKFIDDNGNKKSKCKYCDKEYAADSTINGTSVMLKHIRVCCKNPDNLNNQKIIIQKKENDEEGISGTLKTWKFDQEQVQKALVKMIIIDELPFSFVENEGFKNYMEAACPSFHIPSRYTIARECAQLFLEEKLKLKDYFEKTKQRVSLTIDTRTSIQTMNYLCLTAHYIDDNWNLHKKIINFTSIFSRKGEEIGRTIEKCLLDWGIDNVMTITVDNASSNDVAICYLKSKLSNNMLDGKFLHMRCVAHIISLVVKDGLKEHDDSIVRVREAVKYVRQSRDKLEKFKDCAKESGVDTESLLCLDCPTKWNSTFEMLETSQKFEKAFSLFEIKDAVYKQELEDTCGVPDCDDWKTVRKFASVLEIFCRLTNNISGSLYVPSNQFLHEIFNVDLKLLKWGKSTDKGTKFMALKTRINYDKYRGNMEKMNMLMYVAIVLDPRYKLEFIEFCFEDLYKNENVDESKEDNGECWWKKMVQLVRTATFDLFNDYKNKFEASRCNANVQSRSSSQTLSENKSKIMELFKMRRISEGKALSKTELDRYLNEGCDYYSDGLDILLWWKNNSPRFPVLSRMAKDVLAVQISTVSSESAFSTSGNVLDCFRSSLPATVVEAMICTQDWIRKPRKPSTLELDLANIDNLARDICDQMIVGTST